MTALTAPIELIAVVSASVRQKNTVHELTIFLEDENIPLPLSCPYLAPFWELDFLKERRKEERERRKTWTSFSCHV